MKKILLFLVGMVMTATGMAQKFSCEYEGVSLEYTVLSPEKATATVAFLSPESDVPGVKIRIPSTISHDGVTYTVTEISEKAFQNYTNIESISIPNTITVIRNEAFLGLKDYALIIEDGTGYITSYYSIDKSQVRSLYLGRYVLEFSHLWDGEEWTNLATLTIGNQILLLGDNMFSGSPNLESVTFGSGVGTIGNWTFSNCPKIKEVVLPPSLGMLGTCAFAGCEQLKSVAIGPRLRDLGYEAFRNAPVKIIYMTPIYWEIIPSYYPNVFSDQDAIVYVENEEIWKLYLECDWGGFERVRYLTLPTGMKAENEGVLTGQAGDTFQLAAALEPDDVSLPYVFWKTSDPAVATVSPDGVVTLQKDVEEYGEGCVITALSLYADGPTAEFKVGRGTSGVDSVVVDSAHASIDYTAPYLVYGLDGSLVGTSTDGLAKGIYILRQGDAAKKVLVK